MTGFIRFVLLVLVLVGVALLSAVLTMHFAIHGAEVTMPNLKGMSVAEAERSTAALGLNVSVENRFYSVDVPQGRVMNQAPEPGTVVRREWRVRLTESLGPQKVAIPNLVGQDARAAAIDVRRAGLNPSGSAQLPWAAAQPGTVIAQSPAANAAGVERPVVSLLVAEAEQETAPAFVMPNFVGQPLSGAKQSIALAGLKMGLTKNVTMGVPAVGSTDSTAPPRAPLLPGTILSQNPASGYRVDQNTVVELTVVQ